MSSRIPPKLWINSKHWGHKYAQPAPIWGLDASDRSQNAWLKSKIEDIANNPDEVRQGPWHPGHGGAYDYIFYRQGIDIVVAKGSGEFVTILKDGTNNSWFQKSNPF